MRTILVTILIFTAAITFAVSISAQSRRASPTTNERVNRRQPTPTPSPTVVVQNKTTSDEDASIEEADDVIVVDTKLVTIPVRVIDRKGRFVGGLDKENFRVTENNVEQEISHFSNEAQPFIVALILDMSYSSKFKITDIQSAAIQFVDQLRPEDKVIVISFDEEVHLLSDVTNDRKEIYRAIKSTRVATGTSLYEAVDLAINERLRKLEGRKAMVLFTDGVDTTSRASHDLDNLRDAYELDALIYPIRYDTFQDVQRMKNNPAVINSPSTIGTPPIIPSSGGNPLPSVLPSIGTPGDKGTTREEYDHGEQYLIRLADLTGGTIYVADTVGNLNRAFAKIASELREFYSIGYYPADTENGERTRKIKVRVDRPNVAVKTRNSYVLPDAKKESKRSKE